MAREIDDTTLAEIEAELQGDGVWIDDEFAREHQITAADESRLEQVVADADHADLRMVLVEVSRDDDRFHGRISNLTAWVHDSLGGDATYVGWERYAEPSLRLIAYGEQPETHPVAAVATRDHPGDLTDAVVRSAELLEDGTAEALYEAIPREERYPWTADDAGLLGWVGDLTAGQWGALVVVTAVVVVPLGLAWRARRRRRRAGSDFTLPTAVLRSVRQAEDTQVRQQAEREVLALGEALGAQDPADGSLDVWQQALDHYDAARSVLARAGSPADVVGGLVLARRGDSAREGAVSGVDGWRPPRPCFFNPLHEGQVRDVTWRHEENSVQVPACDACATAVEEGREPDDVLDFIADGSTVHYFRLDIGVWSRTGYGALEPDLVGALRRSHRPGGIRAWVDARRHA